MNTRRDSARVTAGLRAQLAELELDPKKYLGSFTVRTVHVKRDSRGRTIAIREKDGTVTTYSYDSKEN